MTSETTTDEAEDTFDRELRDTLLRFEQSITTAEVFV